MKKAVLIHLIIWLLISLIYVFFISEPITKWLFQGYDDVLKWLWVLAIGLIFILLIILLSLIIAWKRR